MEAVGTIDEVRTFDTRSGNLRYVVRDTDGNEYTTFREFKERVAEDIKDGQTDQ
jgi:hypothetical protein